MADRTMVITVVGAEEITKMTETGSLHVTEIETGIRGEIEMTITNEAEIHEDPEMRTGIAPVVMSSGNVVEKGIVGRVKIGQIVVAKEIAIGRKEKGIGVENGKGKGDAAEVGKAVMVVGSNGVI